MTARWAVYAVPPRAHPLWHLGCAWLGRDPETREPLTRPECGLSPDHIAAVTTAPAFYGFHGTLKPPFALPRGCDEAALRTAVAALAADTAPFGLPCLRPGRLGGFRALLPETDCPALDTLAARCVTELDHFRAPADPAELARRRAAGLSAQETALLERWGYPYVLDRFRFHITLTGPLEATESPPVDAALAVLFAPSQELPAAACEIALFTQPDRTTPFRLVARFPLGSPSARQESP